MVFRFKRRKTRQEIEEEQRQRVLESKLGKPLGRSLQQFRQAGQQESFSNEQLALKSMFGGGERIWGTNNTPVVMYHDLNPRQQGDFGTAELFGFGEREPERDNETADLFGLRRF